MIAEFLVRFYDKPRNRFLCFLGVLFITPILRGVKKDIEREERDLSEKMVLYGRLELTSTLVKRWWTK